MKAVLDTRAGKPDGSDRLALGCTGLALLRSQEMMFLCFLPSRWEDVMVVCEKLMVATSHAIASLGDDREAPLLQRWTRNREEIIRKPTMSCLQVYGRLEADINQDSIRPRCLWPFSSRFRRGKSTVLCFSRCRETVSSLSSGMTYIGVECRSCTTIGEGGGGGGGGVRRRSGGLTPS